tara:strand:- start:91 stop:552 length:462 start_codon:yes stop_codon:yes gene_type:complete
MEKSKAADMISEALPGAEASFAEPINKPVSTPNVSSKEASIMRDARKAILDSMRKELGLPTQGQKPPQPKPLRVPPVTPPPKPVAASPASPDREASRKPRRRPMVPKPVPAASEQPSGKALAAMLRKRSGLKQAMVLSEIFQPPVSLRGQHLS